MSFQDSREYRHAAVIESVRIAIALQIRNMREKKDWSQAKLAEEAGTAQSAVARAEDPEYGRLTISTLFKMAKVFDVGLLVKFVPFKRFEKEYRDFSPPALAVKSFSEEQDEANALSTFSGDVIDTEIVRDQVGDSRVEVGGRVLRFPSQHTDQVGETQEIRMRR